MDRLLIRVPEAAELASISRSLAYELARNGEWPVVRIGRALRIPVAELIAWVADQVERPSDTPSDVMAAAWRSE